MPKLHEDFNPDKENHVDHKWVIMPGTKKPVESVEVGGNAYKFGRDGWLRVSDEGVANAIRQKYGPEMTVTRMRHPSPADRGHRYHFGQMPEMPWKRQKPAPESAQAVAPTGDEDQNNATQEGQEQENDQPKYPNLAE